ncbi:hypothetical protein [Microbacterium capsulatum]|uniref:Uncharacterized protein n=1 Tax=Microbacterium capsulatum TaxID=3041921 RepID=A0ABU0XK16_9MICO|nr:hypothetical protein [Microbacterium sp. ASV81]MDQ4215489.1 hypothetical protein [Microbacterium sp. ASV81]
MTDPFDDLDPREHQPRSPGGSAFPAGSASTAGSAPPGGSAFGPAADPGYVPPSSQPHFAPSATGFATWLVHQPDVTPELFEEMMSTFEGLLVVMRDEGLRPDVPQHVERLIELLIADDDAAESDPDLFDDALSALDGYLHFRIENSRDPEEWEDVHDALEEAMAAHDDAGFDDALNELLTEEDPVPDDVKLRAYAELPILRAIPDLLMWIGRGLTVTATGALRRADIEYVEGLLGLRAHGTNEPWSPRSASDPDAPIAARSMRDVPLLEAWWESLQTARVIERDRSQMRPGPATERASTALTLEVAEEVIGYFLANAVSGSGWFSPVAAEVAVEIIAMLMSAIAPDRIARNADPDEPASMRDEVVEGLAETRLRDLASMGLVVAAADGGWSVPDELRHVVARATVLAATLVMAGDEYDDRED